MNDELVKRNIIIRATVTSIIIGIVFFLINSFAGQLNLMEKILLLISIFLIIIVSFKYIHKEVSDEFNCKIRIIEQQKRELEELNEEIEDTLKEVVMTMGGVAEARSEETGNHVKRVAEYSKLMALYYGLAEAEAELLKQASPMHDIGKLAIPDAILNKPGKFEPKERIIMDTHAVKGYEMLLSSTRPIMQAAAIVAHQHHENWDGTGYPRSLKGEEIHIYGRITAIADVFDALGSDRCYKKAWEDEEIFKLFKEKSGKQFDPKLVDIFFDHLDEFLDIRKEFKDEFNM